LFGRIAIITKSKKIDSEKVDKKIEKKTLNVEKEVKYKQLTKPTSCLLLCRDAQNLFIVEIIYKEKLALLIKSLKSNKKTLDSQP
jgi:hypothetical protein